MGSKNNPGAFDCYAKTEPDEPIFVLRGKDKHAPALVWLWAVLRELDGEKPEKIDEARACAVSMIEWLHAKGEKSVGMGQSVLAGVLELIRGANAAMPKDLKNQPSDVETVRRFFTTTEFENPT